MGLDINGEDGCTEIFLIRKDQRVKDHHSLALKFLGTFVNNNNYDDCNKNNNSWS